MAGIWFCKLAGVVTGPLKPAELRALAEAGKLAPEDLVRQGETGPWVPARNIRGLFSSGGQTGSDSGLSLGRSQTQMGQPATPQTLLPGSERTKREVPSPAQKAQERVLQARRLSEPSPLPSVGPNSVGPQTAPVQGNLSGDSARPDLDLGLPVVLTGVAPRSAGYGLASQSMPAAALHHQRRLQNNLLMIGAFAAVGLLVLVVVILMLTGVISTGPDSQVARKKGAEGLKPVAPDLPEQGSEIADVSWVDASRNAIRRPGVSVRVLSVQVGQLSEDGAAPTGKSLLVQMQVKNQGVDKLLTFSGWRRGGPDGSLLKLIDNKGNTYPQVLLASPIRAEEGESLKRLSPGQTETETLVFQASTKTDEVEYFRLELPGWAFPKDNMASFRFQIPAKMIRTGQEEASPKVDVAEELFGPTTPTDESPKPPLVKQKATPEPPPVPMPKKDPGQEEFERLLQELEKEEPPDAKQEPAAKTESPASEQETPEGTQKEESPSKPSPPLGPRLPGQGIMDHLDTPVPPKSSSPEK